MGRMGRWVRVLMLWRGLVWVWLRVWLGRHNGAVCDGLTLRGRAVK